MVDIQAFATQVIENVEKVIIGKRDAVELTLIGLLGQGHLLIEDVPGVGKTMLARAIAKSIGCSFRRIQFTPDMLPSDVTGVSVFNQKTLEFEFRPGPVMAQIVLTDEINRATPKTQSALLEAMEERQVTIEGKTRTLDKPFFVIATQNPTEQSGTFPLPESQLDRFLMRIDLGYPDRTAEKKLLQQGEIKSTLSGLQPMLTSDDVLMLQQQVAGVHISDALLDYVQDLLEFTRNSALFFVGLSPRAGLNLLSAAKARAFLLERDYALPEDLQQVLPWVVGHRLRSRDEGLEFSRKKLTDLFAEVPVP